MPMMMSRRLFSVATAALLATAAYAQSPGPGPTPSTPSTPTVKLTMDDQHVLKENILKSAKSDGSAGQGDLERGKKVPASVQLHRFPDEIGSKIPQIRSHAYFVTDNSIVIVDPQQRMIVEIVK